MITETIEGPLALLSPLFWFRSFPEFAQLLTKQFWLPSLDPMYSSHCTWLPCFYTMNVRCISQFLLDYAAVTMKIALDDLQKQGNFSLILHVDYWLAVLCSSYSLKSRIKKKQCQKISILCTAVPTAERKKKSNVTPMSGLLKLLSRSCNTRATYIPVAKTRYMAKPKVSGMSKHNPPTWRGGKAVNSDATVHGRCGHCAQLRTLLGPPGLQSQAYRRW